MSYRDTPEVKAKIRHLYNTDLESYYEFLSELDRIEIEEMLQSDDPKIVELAHQLLGPPTAKERWARRIFQGAIRNFDRLLGRPR